MLYRFGTVSGEASGDALGSMRSDVEQQHPLVQVYDPASADLQLARRMAAEVVHVSGADVVIYPRTDNADFDRVWDEDPNPTYMNPVYLKACFRPQPVETELKSWGIDVATNLAITFAYHELYAEFRERMLRVGDVIHIPYNAAGVNPGQYRVETPTPSGNYRYHWLYFTCNMVALTADVTVQPLDGNLPSLPTFISPTDIAGAAYVS